MKLLKDWDNLINNIENSKIALWSIRPSRSQLVKLLETPNVTHVAELQDDPDVYGELFRVHFKTKLLGIYFSFPIADYFFYYEKEYKNRSTYLWHDNADSLEQNFFVRLVTKLMKGLLMTRLKKKLQD